MNNIETQIIEQDKFIREQHGLLTKSIKGFTEILQRISVLKSVAKILKVDPDEAFNEEGNSGLNERLVDRETYEATGLAILGGVIQATEENTLKRLLFRATRGQAILHTFDIVIDRADVLLDTDEPTQYKPRGYFVLFEDGGLRRIVTRVCKSFMGQVYETSLQQVLNDLNQASVQR